jgi:hypothetical protein
MAPYKKPRKASMFDYLRNPGNPWVCSWMHPLPSFCFNIIMWRIGSSCDLLFQNIMVVQYYSTFLCSVMKTDFRLLLWNVYDSFVLSQTILDINCLIFAHFANLGTIWQLCARIWQSCEKNCSIISYVLKSRQTHDTTNSRET